MPATGPILRLPIMKSLAAVLLLVATLDTGGAFAAEGFDLGGGGLATPKASTAKTGDAGADTTAVGNLEADDESYKRICDAFGEGFVYTAHGVCVKIGGYVKFGTSFGGGSLYRR